jgi:hypothetical protein
LTHPGRFAGSMSVISKKSTLPTPGSSQWPESARSYKKNRQYVIINLVAPVDGIAVMRSER